MAFLFIFQHLTLTWMTDIMENCVSDGCVYEEWRLQSVEGPCMQICHFKSSLSFRTFPLFCWLFCLRDKRVTCSNENKWQWLLLSKRNISHSTLFC